jgi:hypothetical protein
MLDLDFEAAVKLGAEVGGKAAASEWRKAQANMIVPVKFYGAVSYSSGAMQTDPATSITYLPFSCNPVVPFDSWWMVHSWRLMKNGSPFTKSGNSPTEIPYVFIGPATDFSSASFEDNEPPPGTPAVAYYSYGQEFAFPGEVVHFAIVSPDTTAGTTYQVSGKALQLPFGSGVPVVETL